MSSGILFDGFGVDPATRVGGFDPGPVPTMLQHYGLRAQGPDEDDAVIINRRIDSSVRPGQCPKRTLSRGYIFSLKNSGHLGTMVPGVWDDDVYPVACILVGSDADDGDVLGGPPSEGPADYKDAQVAMKIEANLPFWPLSSGYIFESSAFRPQDAPMLAPTTVLTAIASLTDFDIAGLLVPGTLYVDHIIGVVIERPAPCGINSSINTFKFIGETIPRIRQGTLAQLRS
jgi:hypothetical protein